MGRWLAQIQKSPEREPTKPTKLGYVSFVSTPSGVFSLLEEFFNAALNQGLELLAEDKHWLKNICCGIELLYLKSLLNQYITCWLDAMGNEPLFHKKQNAGRFTANTFIRESIIIK